MRFYKKFYFLVGRKLEFKELFSCVDSFLAERGICYTSLGYDLTALDDRCHKLSQKMPQLGSVELIQERYSTLARLTNMMGSQICDESSIRLVGSKIPRPYNFYNSFFFYRDIDFFGRQTGFECVTVDDSSHMEVAGSYIKLARGFEGPQSTAVMMSIEIEDMKTCDAADAYAQALSSHLNNVKYVSGNAVYMDSEEKEMFARIRSIALPAVKKAQSDLREKADQVREQLLLEFPDVVEKSYNARSIIQRIGKKHGLDRSVRNYFGELYFYKQVRSGVVLSVEVQSTSSSGIDMGLMLSGPGFCYRMVNLSGCPANVAEANYFVSHMFDLVEVFEAEYLNDILQKYPQFPDWIPVLLED